MFYLWPSDEVRNLINMFQILYIVHLEPCQTFLEALHSKLQGGKDYMRRLVQTSLEVTGSWSSSPMIVSRDSFSPWSWARFQMGGTQPTLAEITIFLIYTSYQLGCVYWILLPLCFGGCWSIVSIRRIINKYLNMSHFDCTTVAGSWKVKAVNR